MRRSALKHPLAVLRTTIGITQKEMADLLNCSRQAVQGIELGSLDLSDEMAMRISSECDVSVEWLLAGNPAAPAKTRAGKTFSKATWEEHRASIDLLLRAVNSPALKDIPRKITTYAMPHLATMLHIILEQGLFRRRLDLYSYKLRSALLEVAKELKVDVSDNAITWKKMSDTCDHVLESTLQGLTRDGGKLSEEDARALARRFPMK